jgi:hypothetical protein
MVRSVVFSAACCPAAILSPSAMCHRRSAPLVTGIYALLTKAQPFWAELHDVVRILLGGGTGKVGGPVDALDAGTARALCALLLSGMFLSRTVKDFGGLETWRQWIKDRDTVKGGRTRLFLGFWRAERLMSSRKIRMIWMHAIWHGRLLRPRFSCDR